MSGPQPCPPRWPTSCSRRCSNSVFGLLFGQPERRLQSAEPIRLAGAGTCAVQRLLTRLASTRLLRLASVGHQMLYQANKRLVSAELVGLVRTRRWWPHWQWPRRA